MAHIDQDLLFLYSENARYRLPLIGKLLKKSPQRLKYNIKALETQGVIFNPYCVIDYARFGLLMFRVYFKGGYIGETDKARIIKNLSKNEYVVSIYELGGEFDLAIEFLAPNPSKFNKELQKVVSLIPTFSNYKILLNVVTHIYPRKYLTVKQELRNQFGEEAVVGGDRTIETFSDNELKVIKVFLEDPKSSLSKAAKKSCLNVKTVTSILRSMEERKIIRGFKYSIDGNKLGLYSFRLFLRLRDIDQEKSAEFLQYILNTKEITLANRTVGDWDMEIDIVSFDRTRTRRLIIEIREKYKDIIENFNITEFYQLYQKTYLPAYMFKEEAK